MLRACFTDDLEPLSLFENIFNPTIPVFTRDLDQSPVIDDALVNPVRITESNLDPMIYRVFPQFQKVHAYDIQDSVPLAIVEARGFRVCPIILLTTLPIPSDAK